MKFKMTEEETIKMHEEARAVVSALDSAIHGENNQNLVVLPATDKHTGKTVSVIVAIRPAVGGGVYMAPLARVLDYPNLNNDLEFEEGIFDGSNETKTREQIDAESAGMNLNTFAAPATVQ